MTLLSANDLTTVTDYLERRSLLAVGEAVHAVAPAGEGNMNVTLSVTTDRRTVVVKQSRPFVAKFPQLPAPLDRIVTEHAYLSAAARVPALAARQPRVLHFDAENYVLVLEYLAGAEDLSYVYAADRSLPGGLTEQLGTYLSELHQLDPAGFSPNRELRALNHAHIFDLPFRTDNGFTLDEMQPGLAEAARPYQNDEALCHAAAELGGVYLSGGPTLVHGDFYPGSFMIRGGQLFVIDGEFAHPGRAEFDVGVLLGHLVLAGEVSPPERQFIALAGYAPPQGFDWDLASRFAAVEIMRRLIGIAQLPLDLPLAARQEHLARARAMMVD